MFQGYFCHFIFFRVILVVLELWGYFGQLRGFGGFFFFDILWFWGYFGDFGNIMTILVISRVFFMSKKNYFNHKNYQNINKRINTTKPLKWPPITAKMTKMPNECQKYPKTLKNDQNTPKKTTTTTLKTLKMTKIPLNPQK